MSDCPYSIKHREGLREWMTCKVTNNYCPHMRRCISQNTVINTESATSCQYRINADKKGC